MLILIATCLLAAGTTFTPAPEWTITEIMGGGGRPEGPFLIMHPITCMDKTGLPTICPEPDRLTRITTQRLLAPGQVAEPPQGCTLKVEVKE